MRNCLGGGCGWDRLWHGSPSPAMLHLPSSRPSHCSHQPAKGRKVSPHTRASWHPGKQAMWGVQGAAGNWGCQGPRNIQCPEANPVPVEHLEPGGIEDVGAHPGPGDTGDLGQHPVGTCGHPGPRGASGTLLGIKYPASSRIQRATSPRGKSNTQSVIGHSAASGTPGENVGPGWASGTWGYLGSGGASRTWVVIPYPAASRTHQHPVPGASHTGSLSLVLPPTGCRGHYPPPPEPPKTSGVTSGARLSPESSRVPRRV